MGKPMKAEEYCNTCLYRNYKRFFLCIECRWNPIYKDNYAEEPEMNT